MSDFREVIPTLTGPGAYFVFLLILAIMIFDIKWFHSNIVIIVGLVALSIPFSVVITQIYHALFRIYGFGKLDFIKTFKKKGREEWKNLPDYLVDAKVDFLALTKSEKENFYLKDSRELISRQSSAFHLSMMFFGISAFFTIAYPIALIILVRIYNFQFNWDFLFFYSTILIIFCELLSVLFWQSSIAPWNAWNKLEEDMFILTGTGQTH